MLLRICSSVSLIVSMFQRYTVIVISPHITTTTATVAPPPSPPLRHWPMLRVLLQPSLLGMYGSNHTICRDIQYSISTPHYCTFITYLTKYPIDTPY